MFRGRRKRKSKRSEFMEFVIDVLTFSWLIDILDDL